MYTVKKLDAIKTPLVNKFYAKYHVRGRANKQDEIWVVYNNIEIIAACRLQEKNEFLFLSTVFVAPAHRSKGLAKKLLLALLHQQSRTVYSFAYKNIIDLYTDIGFNQVLTYTKALSSLYNLYKHRNLVVIKYP